MTERDNETRIMEQPELLELTEEKYWSCDGRFTVWKRIQHFVEGIFGKYKIYTAACLTPDEALMQAHENQKKYGFIWDGQPPQAYTLDELLKCAQEDGDAGVTIEQWTPEGWFEVEYYEVVK